MTNTLRFFLLICALPLVLGLSTQGALAQPTANWQQVYSKEGTCQRFLQTADKGYWLIGTSDIPVKKSYNRRLQLIRTDAYGQQLWTKHVQPEGSKKISVTAAAQQPDGRVLVVSRDIENNYAGPATFYLTSFTPSGNVQWTRRLDLGMCACYIDAATALANGVFVVAAANRSSGSTLLYLDADGTTLREEPFKLPFSPGVTTISNLTTVPGGMLVSAAVSKGRVEASQIVLVSNQGVLGAATNLLSNDNSTNLPVFEEQVQQVLALGGNEYLVVGRRQAHRITLGDPAPIWSSYPVATAVGGGILGFSAAGAVPMPDGSFVFFGNADSSHSRKLYVVRLGADGTSGTTPLGLPGNSRFVTDGDNCWAAGAFPGTRPGTAVIAGNGSPGVFLSSGTFEQLEATGKSIMQVWPNPVSDADELNVSGMFAVGPQLELYNLHGRMVRTWTRAEVNNGQVSLRGLLPGTYILMGTSGSGKRAGVRVVKQ